MGLPIIADRQTDFQKREQNVDFFTLARKFYLYDVSKSIWHDFYKNSFSIWNTCLPAYLKSENHDDAPGPTSASKS